MNTSVIFERNIVEYDNGSSLIINQGGTSSGKSYSILQILYLIAKLSKKRLVISVCSYALPHLKLGAMRDFENILIDAGENIDRIRNKTDNTYNIGNSIIEFFGTDNLGKVHGPRRDILFINEANYIKYDIYTQLAIRTRGTIFIDFNPSQSFWIHSEVIPKEKHSFIKSTYLDNLEFLDTNTIARIESRRGNANWWRVYGEGEIGSLEGTILKNWRFTEDDEIEKAFRELPTSYGMDYGFYPDPDACSKIAIDNGRRKIYCDELFYTTNNSTDDLVSALNSINRNDLIVAESATPRTNTDIRRRGFNIVAVSKTGTVGEWLKELQDYEFIISLRSVNLSKELQNYAWSDKKAGVPIDAFNHLIDGIRYNYMYHHTKAKRSVIKSTR